MVGRWWWTVDLQPRLLVLLVAACIGLAATVVQARSMPGPTAATGTEEPPACRGGTQALRSALTGNAGDGTWFRLDPILERGAIVAHELVASSAAAERPIAMVLDREAFAWGPKGGVILAGSDDGTRTRLFALDPGAGCLVGLGDSGAVVRRAVLDPDGAAVVEFRVDRVTRADLGVWRRPLDGAAPIRWLDPIDPDARFGITWSTELAWSAAGDRLVVQSCGEHACRTRLRDRGGDVVQVPGDGQGPLIGLAGDRLVTLAACPGLPCPLRTTDLAAGATEVLHGSSGIARLLSDQDGRARVVHEVIGGTTRLRSVLPDGEAPLDLGPLPALDGLLGSAAYAGSDAQTAPGQVPLGPDGRVATDGIHLLDEVLR